MFYTNIVQETATKITPRLAALSETNKSLAMRTTKIQVSTHLPTPPIFSILNTGCLHIGSPEMDDMRVQLAAAKEFNVQFSKFQTEFLLNAALRNEQRNKPGKSAHIIEKETAQFQTILRTIYNDTQWKLLNCGFATNSSIVVYHQVGADNYDGYEDAIDLTSRCFDYEWAALEVWSLFQPDFEAVQYEPASILRTEIPMRQILSVGGMHFQNLPAYSVLAIQPMARQFIKVLDTFN